MVTRDVVRLAPPVLAVAAALAAATLVNYHAGGSHTALPHLFYVPVFAAAVLGGPMAGFAVGLAAGLLAGPFLTPDVDEGMRDPVSAWLLRLSVFCAVGIFTGALVFRLRRGARELSQLIEQTVLAFVSAIESRDPYTAQHSVKVTDHAMQLADALGVDADTRDRVRWAGLLHDLGKIALPEAVLNKPALLEPDEWALVKQHPVHSAEIVGGIARYRPYLPAIRHHHERYDGGGYPDGLRENQIPLEARILAVADAFDAMTSTRQYRAAMPEDEALARILAGAGSQFDPAVAQTFAHYRRSLGASPVSATPETTLDAVHGSAKTPCDAAGCPPARWQDADSLATSSGLPR